MPGVSTNTICAPSTFSTPWMLVRVVCGLRPTMAIFSPNSAFSSVDLPAFGRPRIETKPALVLNALFHGRRLGDTHLLDSQFVSGEYLNANAIPLHDLAHRRDAAHPFRHETAYCGRFGVFVRPKAQQI